MAQGKDIVGCPGAEVEAWSGDRGLNAKGEQTRTNAVSSGTGEAPAQSPYLFMILM